MNAQESQTLIDYNSWANRRMLDVAATLSEEQFHRDLGGSHASVHHTLFHILGAEWIWLERWKGRTPAALPTADQFGSFSEIRERWQIVETEMREFAGDLTDADLLRIVVSKTANGERFELPLGQLVQHRINHSSYHRGAVTTMFRQLGVRPAVLDLFRYFLIKTGQKHE